MIRPALWRLSAAAFLLLMAVVAALHGPRGAVAEDATPSAYSCETAATPAADMGHGTMEMGSPATEMDMSMEMELDQLYIDMMIPHHASIIALAQAARPELTDERLVAITDNIVAAQSAEIEELRGYREQFYGDPEPMPMDDHTMQMMLKAMPGMGSVEEMMFQMDAERQVSAFCATEDKDLAFTKMVIAHHQMAIDSSGPVVEGAAHEEIRAFAQRVIDDQQREIEELEMIQVELTGESTPAESPTT